MFAFVVLATGCGAADAAPPASLAFADERPTQLGCGSSEFTIEFPASVVLGAETTAAGPYDLALPEGTYTIRTASWMGPAGDAGANQRWYITTNGGFESPLTSDSSPVGSTVNQFDNQALEASSTITIHLDNGAGLFDEVHPLCIGLTRTGS